MAINVDGYNATFQSFVDFAKVRNDMGEKNAIARVGMGVNVSEGALAGRTITASSTDSIRGMFKWFRSSDDKAANNEARKLFRDAIVDMFGGESKIPRSVLDAMKLADYDKGKPLTARRILAVKAAIDASGTKEARAGKLRLESFQSPEVEKAAGDMGYMKSELPKLARAAHFYAEAKGVSEMDAMREVGRPGSEANRLMNYGGRFLESAENFRNGLRLISQFSAWHDGISAKDGNDTLTKINADIRAGSPRAKFGLERFLFEDIATNPDFDLSEPDPERAFGVGHNMASRFMTTASNTSTIGTIANMPPEKRRVAYAAFNAFNTLATDRTERGERKSVSQESIFLARVIKNLPKLEAIMAKTGTLTGRDVIKNCFPDIRNPGNYDTDTINAWENDLSKEVLKNPVVGGPAVQIMESSGATLREAANAVAKGERLPDVQYFSSAQYSIEEASSVSASGIKAMNGDICRLSTYQWNNKGKGDHPVFSVDSHAWKFNFPDGSRLTTSGVKHDDIPRVGEKIRQLCGEVHQKQIGNVAFLLSQSGTGVMLGQPLRQYGIVTNEHTPVDYTLSRNDETGDVTITYTSPAELPVKFTWSATVGIDGSVTRTPFTVQNPEISG